MTDEYVSDAFIYMRERHLPYPVFDADNHMYENTDALTKFIPPEYEGVIKYVEINNRTKIAFKDKISDFIPNPTFARVGPPGGTEADPQHRRGIPSVDAFFDPEPRLTLMKDMGIDRSMIWPTLATGVEERLSEDPDAIQVVLRAFNRWMLEHWTYNYADAMYPTPMISLSVLDDALEELEFVVAQRCEVIPPPHRAGAHLEGTAFLRPARVRPVLGSGPGGRHLGRDAPDGLGLSALHERVGGLRRQ